MNNLKLEVIDGVKVAIYANEKGGCWMFEKNGETYGAYINSTGDEEELKGILKTHAKETLKSL